MNQLFRYKRTVLLLSLLAITGLGCGKKLPVYGQIPDFSLVNQENQTVSKVDLLGKTWVANFIYTGCSDICPLLSQRMEELGKAWAGNDKVHMVSISVDPENDTPERLTKYAARFNADPTRWSFLTGPTEDVKETVEQGFKLSMGTTSDQQIFHAEKFVLVDKRGQIRGYYDGTPESLLTLHKDMKKLIKEGKLGRW